MRRKLLALAVLSAVSAGALADTLYVVPDKAGPQTRVPDNARIVTQPATVAMPVQPATVVTPAQPAYVVPAPSASAGSSVAVPANPAVVATAPAVVTTPMVVAPSVPITKFPGQSGPGATDKIRPGIDDPNNHSSWDVGTSSAGG